MRHLVVFERKKREAVASRFYKISVRDFSSLFIGLVLHFFLRNPISFRALFLYENAFRTFARVYQRWVSHENIWRAA